MYNQDNAHDIATFPDEKSTKRSEPKNQAHIKIKSQQFLKFAMI